MAFRKYIIRNRDNEAWLAGIGGTTAEKVYRYVPEIAKAIVYETLTEAQRIAKACRGRVQVLKMSKGRKAYAEDLKE